MSIFAKPQGEGDDKKKTIIVKKVVKAEDKDKKVVSSDSIGSGTDSFFGGLGFKKKVEPVKPKVIPVKEQEEIAAVKKEQEKQAASEEFFEQASQIAKKNAVVIRSAEPNQSRGNTANKGNNNRGNDKRSNVNF